MRCARRSRDLGAGEELVLDEDRPLGGVDRVEEQPLDLAHLLLGVVARLGAGDADVHVDEVRHHAVGPAIAGIAHEMHPLAGRAHPARPRHAAERARRRARPPRPGRRETAGRACRPDRRARGLSAMWSGVSQRRIVMSRPPENATASSTMTSFWCCEAPNGTASSSARRTRSGVFQPRVTRGNSSRSLA